MNNGLTIAGIVIFAIIIIALIASICCICCKKPGSCQEGFMASGGQGAYIDEQANAIRGPALYTDSMMHRNNWCEITDNVRKTGVLTDNIDGKTSLGPRTGNAFENAYESQKKVIDLYDNGVNKGYVHNDVAEKISEQINTSSGSNGNNSLFNRGSSTCGKLINSTDIPLKAVIDEKYLPYRDKNYNIYKVGTIIHCQGFDEDVSRLGEALNDTSFAKYVRHKQQRQISSAGATYDDVNTGNINKLVSTNGTEVTLHMNKKDDPLVPVDDARIQISNATQSAGSYEMTDSSDNKQWMNPNVNKKSF